jgi:hypothetical protein
MLPRSNWQTCALEHTVRGKLNLILKISPEQASSPFRLSELHRVIPNFQFAKTLSVQTLPEANNRYSFQCGAGSAGCGIPVGSMGEARVVAVCLHALLYLVELCPAAIAAAVLLACSKEAFKQRSRMREGVWLGFFACTSTSDFSMDQPSTASGGP